MDAAYRIIGWNASEPRFPPGPLILERRLLPGKPVMRSITRDVLTREVIDWHQQGLIDRPLLDMLLPRYETQGRFLAALLKWLGLFALFQLGLAVLICTHAFSNTSGIGCLSVYFFWSAE
jgi:hypothetical protein